MATNFALVTNSMQTDEPCLPARRIEAKRVLLVDDAEGTSHLMARLLGMLGHQVSLAHSGQTAIDTALHLKPHLILLDLQLPDMGGCEVARTLRRSADLAGSLFVALTGYSDQETREEAATAGFDEFIVKPAAIETLERLFCHPKLAILAG